MGNWKQDKRWSDKFLKEIKGILGENLIGEPPIEEDMEHNTDLMVLKMDAVRIGCRVRRYGYFENYQKEFTFRVGRPSGHKTELAKIIEGWGDFFFYGFSDKAEVALISWRLCDLNVFRLWFTRKTVQQKQVPGRVKQNRDMSSTFMVFNFDDLPKKFIIASF